MMVLDDDFTPSSITDRQPVASTTDLNSSCLERAEELFPAEKDFDELNDTCEDASSNRSETETTVLTVSLTANEDVNDCNSSTTAPVCKVSETPESGVSGVAYKSPLDILPLPKASERKQTNRKKKGRSLILTNTPEKKDLKKKQKKEKVNMGKSGRFSKENNEDEFKQKENTKQSKSIVSSEFFRQV